MLSAPLSKAIYTASVLGLRYRWCDPVVVRSKKESKQLKAIAGLINNAGNAPEDTACLGG